MTRPDWLTQARLQLLAYLTVVVCGVAGFIQLNNVSERNATATEVLCAERTALVHKIERTQEFLIDNPEGIPGIPKAVIVRGLEDDKATLAIYGRLAC